jgi:hypothetical protein
MTQFEEKYLAASSPEMPFSQSLSMSVTTVVAADVLAPLLASGVAAVVV